MIPPVSAHLGVGVASAEGMLVLSHGFCGQNSSLQNCTGNALSCGPTSPASEFTA